MDLSYNKEIDLSEVFLPAKFIFQKNEDFLYLEPWGNKKFRVTSSNIEITLKDKSFFIERDNIAEFSIETNTNSIGKDSYMISYSLIINLKNEVAVPSYVEQKEFSFIREMCKKFNLSLLNFPSKKLSEYKKQIKLFRYNYITSKLTILFFIQEFSKILHLPFPKSPNSESFLDVPNFLNFDVIKNDSQNLTIKQNSLYPASNYFGKTLFYNIFLLLLTIASICFVFKIISDNPTLFSYGSLHFITSGIGIFFLPIVVCIMLCFIHYPGNGTYISIDSFQIVISKLKFLTAKPSKTKKIKIDENMSIGINKLAYTMNQNYYAIVLSTKSFWGLKKYSRFLISNITLQEAEYIIKKISYLANNEVTIDNNITVKKKNQIYTYIFFILLGIFMLFGIPYLIYFIMVKFRLLQYIL